MLGEILQQLKEKFHSTSQNSMKVQILTILPKSWSIQKIQTEFGVSNFMARKAKQLVKDKGVLSSPDPRPGRHVSQETFDNVVGFYENDEHSRHELTSANDISLSTYHHCLARMMCNPPLPDCYLGECEVCPGTDPRPLLNF